jgi:large subunit ribosomal protein L9
MEVILLERVGRLGTVGDVVKVKNGYGRNYLLPQKKALRASVENKKVFEARRAEIEAKNAAGRAEAEKQAKAMGSLSVTLVRQASEDGKLYGSVGTRDIAEALAEQGHEVDRRQVDLAATLKNTGT